MEALGSTWKHLEALGSKKGNKKTRKHLAIPNKNPNEGKHWEGLGSTRKHLEALGSTWKHLKALGSTRKQALGSTWKPLEALGSIMEKLGSTRKHLAVFGSNPKKGKHWKALGSKGSTRKH